MSRRESEREDLLREATGVVERAELGVPGYVEHVVIGFRRDSSASFYFGADPVYQFNTAGELRRAYVDGVLYKAERGRLVSLTRQRGEAQVTLFRAELSDDQLAPLLQALHDRFVHLRQAFTSGSLRVVGQVPADTDVVQRIKDWLAA